MFVYMEINDGGPILKTLKLVFTNSTNTIIMHITSTSYIKLYPLMS